MVKCKLKPYFLAVVVLTVMMLSPLATAQNYWLHPGEEKSLSLEIYKPKYAEDENVGFFNSVWFISGHFKAGDKISVFVEIPVSFFDINEDKSYYEDETLLGNPYIGFVSKSPMTNQSQLFVGRVGVRLPIASDEKRNASVNGQATTFNRFEAFFPDIFTLTAGLGFEIEAQSGIEYLINFDGAMMIPTEGEGDSELFLDYNFAIWFPFEKINFGAGFAGRLLVTESDLDLGERTFHQFGFTGNYKTGQFKPGIHFRMPLDDDLTEIIDYVYGPEVQCIICLFVCLRPGGNKKSSMSWILVLDSRPMLIILGMSRKLAGLMVMDLMIP